MKDFIENMKITWELYSARAEKALRQMIAKATPSQENRTLVWEALTLSAGKLKQSSDVVTHSNFVQSRVHRGRLHNNQPPSHPGGWWWRLKRLFYFAPKVREGKRTKLKGMYQPVRLFPEGLKVIKYDEHEAVVTVRAIRRANPAVYIGWSFIMMTVVIPLCFIFIGIPIFFWMFSIMVPKVDFVIQSESIWIRGRLYDRKIAGQLTNGYSVQMSLNSSAGPSFFAGLRMEYGDWGEELPYMLPAYFAAEQIVFIQGAIATIQTPDQASGLSNNLAQGYRKQIF